MPKNLFAGNHALLTGILFFLTACGIVQAGTLGVLTYEIDGENIIITDCEGRATGTVIIPGRSVIQD